MKELGLDLGLFVSQAINFVLFAALLSATLIKPIMRKLEERSDRIRKGLQDARDAEETLQRATRQAQSQLDQARREGREIIESATRSAEQQRQEIIANARQEAHEVIQRAQEQVDRERLDLQIRLRDEMIDVSLAAASRLVARELDDATHRELVEQFLSEADQMPQER